MYFRRIPSWSNDDSPIPVAVHADDYDDYHRYTISSSLVGWAASSTGSSSRYVGIKLLLLLLGLFALCLCLPQVQFNSSFTGLFNFSPPIDFGQFLIRVTSPTSLLCRFLLLLSFNLLTINIGKFFSLLRKAKFLRYLSELALIDSRPVVLFQINHISCLCRTMMMMMSFLCIDSSTQFDTGSLLATNGICTPRKNSAIPAPQQQFIKKFKLRVS